MRALVLLVPLLMLAGCLDPTLGTAQDRGEEQVTGHFTAAMTLHPQPDGESRGVPTGSFYRAWAQGDDYPTWEAPPARFDSLVTRLHVHLVVRATGPVLESVRFPDLMVYGGAGGAWTGFASVTDQTHFLPGRTYAFDLDLALPEGGLWLPAQERLGLKVVPVMQQNEQADIEVVVGPAGSRAEWIAKPRPHAPLAWTGGSTEGETRGSAYAGENAPDSVSHRTRVALGPDVEGLVVWMNTTSHTGIPDLDLHVEAPDGKVLAFAGTPTPRESIRLAKENLHGAGDYTLVATSYGSAQATFRMEWIVAGPSPAG